jgi:septum formation protein
VPDRDTQRLILASSSPRRRELLAQLGLPFDVQPATIEEPLDRPEALPPRAWAEALASFKAQSVALDHPQRWVLGADTIVVCGDAVLGKPTDADDARRMLRLQAGRACDVITGVCLLRRQPALERYVDSDVTRVWMRDAPQEIERYTASGDWRGKAGAYGIQDIGDRLIERIEGSFSNVVGLPLELLQRLLTGAGLTTRDAPER